jgi:hypothetical protein
MSSAAVLAASLIAGFALIQAMKGDGKASASPNDELEFTGWARLQEHEEVAAEILEATGHHGSIRVYLDTLNPHLCAYAYVAARVVVLTEKCSAPPSADGRTNWRVVGVLAHEIGHIVSTHPDASLETTRSEQEEADAFAGFAMRRLGATLEDAQTFRVPEPEPFAHMPEPDKGYLAAIERGWTLAAFEEAVSGD